MKNIRLTGFEVQVYPRDEGCLRQRGFTSVGIGKIIANHRHEKGWTQEYFAELISVSVGYYRAIEEENKIPSIKVLARIAKALNLSIDELLKEDN